MTGSYEGAPVLEEYLRSLGLAMLLTARRLRSVEEMALEVGGRARSGRVRDREARASGKAGLKVVAATALLSLIGCTPYLGDGGGYAGSAEEMRLMAVGARQCGIRHFRVADEGRETRLYLRQPRAWSRRGRCMSDWMAANAPDAALVFVAQ